MSSGEDIDLGLRHLDDGHVDLDNDSEGSDIENPRLEDSRASLLQLAHEQPYEMVMMLLPQCKPQHQNPLLSSTLVQETTASGADQDSQGWPNASSIRLANSRESVGLSDLLNNANISLSAATDEALSVPSRSASGSVSAPAIAAPVPAPATSAAANAATDDSIDSLSAVSSAGSFLSSSGGSANPDSAPRLRVLASNSDAASLPEPMLTADQRQNLLQQQQPPPQQALGLLQVCRLTLDVLTDCRLLRDEATRWLTPELLCDKVCDRLHHPRAAVSPTPDVAGAVAGDSTTSEVPDLEFDSPVGRVQHWLMAGEGGCGLSPSAQRHVTNTV